MLLSCRQNIAQAQLDSVPKEERMEDFLEKRTKTVWKRWCLRATKNSQSRNMTLEICASGEQYLVQPSLLRIFWLTLQWCWVLKVQLLPKMEGFQCLHTRTVHCCQCWRVNVHIFFMLIQKENGKDCQVSVTLNVSSDSCSLHHISWICLHRGDEQTGKN